MILPSSDCYHSGLRLLCTGQFTSVLKRKQDESNAEQNNKEHRVYKLHPDPHMNSNTFCMVKLFSLLSAAAANEIMQ